MKKCKCGSKTFYIQVIPCCDDCIENGARKGNEYIYDEELIFDADMERNEAYENGECRMGTAFGSGCYMFTCTECGKRDNLPVMEGC